MNNNTFDIDDSQIRKMFSELTSKDRKKVFKQAITKALNIVKKEAISNLKKSINPSMIGHKDKYGMSFRSGIKTKAYKSGNMGVIHIMKNYKLKFYELGTADRYQNQIRGRLLKKRKYVGNIQPYHFFTNAKRSKEQEVFNSIEQLLVKSIEKINNKYR